MANQKTEVEKAIESLCRAKAKAEKAGLTVKVQYVEPLTDGGSIGRVVLPNLDTESE